MRHGTLETSAASGRMDATEAVLKSANHVDAVKDKLVAAWSPTKEWLSTYQKGAIEGFCKQRGVGFATAYDETNGKGAFSKLVKKKKDEMIAEILAFSFDWSAVAPKELTDLVK